jgi:hypothetical protein
MRFLALGIFFPLAAFSQTFNGFSIDSPSFPSTSQRTLAVEPTSGMPPIDLTPPPVHVVAVGSALRGAPKLSAKPPVILEFKNHTVDSALRCWRTGSTVHYIDLLNREHSVAARSLRTRVN